MTRPLPIAVACAFAVLPLVSAAAMPRSATRAAVATSGDAVVLAHGNYNFAGDRGPSFTRALDRPLRVVRDRDDSWSRGLRRFRDTFD